MSVTKEEVLRLGKLSRIKIDDIDQVSSQLSGIFSWIDQLNDAHNKITNKSIQENAQYCHLERQDINPSPDQRNFILQNAPHRVHDFFVVPKVKE